FGTWTWDASQKASGTSSQTEPSQSGLHYHGFSGAWAELFYVAATDKLFSYVLIDPCDPPQEILIQWDDGQLHRAFWGSDQIGWGDLGVDRIDMGALPATGQWVRLEVPASTLHLQSRTVAGVTFALFDGHAWFDRTGVAPTCTPSIASAPTLSPNEQVW